MSKQTYGARVHAPELQRFLTHVLAPVGDGKVVSPICIWGKHGIGKTEMVRAFAKNKGWGFREIAPAQFEEMGDFLGMPAIEQGVTELRPPSWVPREVGPGILLLDDFNRADDRIIRGLMPLLQGGGLVSWALPDQWTIILTANPDSGDYSVTPLDEAILTRMIHITLAFDVHAWLFWAGEVGLDIRGIDFVGRYPELVTGVQTTPRTLEQFIRLASNLPDWRRSRSLVQHLAEACLDPETVGGLMQFISLAGHNLPSPAALLKAGAADTLKSIPVTELWSVLERLLRFLEKENPSLTPEMMDHLRQIFLLENTAKDQRMAFAQRLTALGKPRILQLLSEPDVVATIL